MPFLGGNAPTARNLYRADLPIHRVEPEVHGAEQGQGEPGREMLFIKAVSCYGFAPT